MNSRTLFITGTDTGVGKTLVTALLALHLQARGIDVGVMKPWASGCILQSGELVSEDAQWLREAVTLDDDLNLINPLRYEEPLAPLVAARRLSRDTSSDFSLCRVALSELQKRHEYVLVEGVGGLLAPLCEDKSGALRDCADLANFLESPVVVVARRTLGTINHTLLTCRYALREPAHFAGLVFCDAQETEEGDIAANSSPDLISEISGLPIWGCVPHLHDLSHETLLQQAARMQMPILST